jgi:hypothetical protein
MTTLTDLIPVIGGGKPLFSFLYEHDLYPLKATCKALKADVEAYTKRWEPKPIPLLLRRVRGRLTLLIEGEPHDVTRDSFFLWETDFDMLPISEEEYRRKLIQAHEICGKDHPWLANRIRALEWRRYRAHYGIMIHRKYPSGDHVHKILRDKKEYIEWCSLMKDIRPKIEEEHKRF